MHRIYLCWTQKSQGTYHPLFDKFGVDIVLEGHVHNYQRSYPIACNPKNLSSPIVTSASESNYNNPEGQIYVIVGTGGINLQGLSGKTPYMASQQDSKFGVLAMRFSENKLKANLSPMMVLSLISSISQREHLTQILSLIAV